jgi:protein-tyrosine phosphatase
MAGQRILIVCSGNICRSPMAEVVLDHFGRQAGLGLVVDSAGTGSWHAGEAMDRRATAALGARGYDRTGHLARQVDPNWLDHRDLVLAADRGHQRDLKRLAAPIVGAAPITLLGAFVGGNRSTDAQIPDIPDPYYGDAEDFARCLDLIERCCAGLVAHLADPAPR